uniref:Candidate secreted effector n=1 Tax=Meloidogyne incognita TaxID=6306 RepID=A0A914NCE7_MELIC
MSGTFRQMLGECSSICFGICRSSSGICLESVFVGVLTAGVWNSPGSAWSSSSVYVGECSG